LILFLHDPNLPVFIYGYEIQWASVIFGQFEKIFFDFFSEKDFVSPECD